MNKYPRPEDIGWLHSDLRNPAYDESPVGIFAGYCDPELCSCNGEEPCHRCGAHIGCPCHK